MVPRAIPQPWDTLRMFNASMPCVLTIAFAVFRMCSRAFGIIFAILSLQLIYMNNVHYNLMLDTCQGILKILT
jgi:hypothetical protein